MSSSTPAPQRAWRLVFQAIPPIYLDRGTSWSPTPCSDGASSNGEWPNHRSQIDTIFGIQAIPEARLLEIQRRGKKYVAPFLSPVTDGAIGAFLEG